MRAKISKTAYQWADATERLKSIRARIVSAEVLLHNQEWTVTRTKQRIARLEKDREKVEAGLVRRP